MSKASDKTREKLLNTMRKTKADAAEVPAKPAAAKKAPAKKKAAKKPKAAPKAKAASKPRAKAKKKSAQAATDPYQGARRIWPD